MPRTCVGIVGAGPAGLVLSHLLEARSREYVEQRVRAGVLEHPSVELLRQLGLADRLDREALVHHGIELAFDGGRHRIDLTGLTGRSITVYGQQEVVKDLIAARLRAGGELRFEVSDVELSDLGTDRPRLRFRQGDADHELLCDVIAGCDGFHGVSRPAVPADRLRVDERTYPFAWLGILARAAPTTHELIYSAHDRGFALYSMRSPEITRLYLQVAPDENVADWSDDRVWDELTRRLPTDAGLELREGPIIEKSITPMRSFVATPMRHGRLFLAGDAAHIVPPTGAKGMNLAIADVSVLAEAIDHHRRTGREDLFDGYSDLCQQRVWRVQHFSWWMTSMLHRLGDGDGTVGPTGAPDPAAVGTEGGFQRRLQLAELAYVTSSTAASTVLAENYVGLPFGRLHPSGAGGPARPRKEP